jgi:branched-chain amino acid transport system ATP-binding protein
MLEIKNLNLFYGQIQVLHDISFTVKSGEIVALIGANSSGKTSLISAISGIIPIKSGEVYFDSKDITKLKPHHIVESGIVHIPEGRHLFPQMTVMENLQMGAYPETARNNIDHTLANVFSLFPKLKERENQLAGSLSGGEGQMLAIARGLMAMPKLLMLDEPSLGLAPAIVKNIFQIIKQLHSAQASILLVEQNVRQSLEFAHRAYVMENGKIVLSGTGESLLDDDRIRKAYLGL